MTNIWKYAIEETTVDPAVNPVPEQPQEMGVTEEQKQQVRQEILTSLASSGEGLDKDPEIIKILSKIEDTIVSRNLYIIRIFLPFS